MGIKVISECLNCGKVETKQNTQGKYCSNKCQAEYQSKVKYENWKHGKGRIGKGALRTNMLREFGDVCSVCGITDWNGKSITKEIDHIDGNPYNNVPENLRLICPNCHSQTETYKARNKGSGRKLNPQKGWLIENASKA